MFFKKKDNEKPIEDMRKVSDKVDDVEGIFIAENQQDQPQNANGVVDESVNEQPQVESEQADSPAQVQHEDSVGEPSSDVFDVVTPSEAQDKPADDSQFPEDVLNNFPLHVVVWINFGQPTSVPLVLGIGFNFEPQEEYIPTGPFETPDIARFEECVPPPGTIDTDTFLDSLLEFPEPYSRSEAVMSFLNTYGDGEIFNVSIGIEDIHDLDDVLDAIYDFNEAFGDFEDEYSADIEGEFTLFLGDNTFSFEDLPGNYGPDGDRDFDIRLNGDVSLHLLGCGCTNTKIVGDGQSRIFDIYEGDVTITGVELTGGAAFGEGGGDGGAIRNAGDLTLVDSCVVDNCAYRGGGIYTYQRDIFNMGEGSPNELNLINSVVLDNKAMYHGGGIWGEGTEINITEGSRVDNNYAGVELGEGCELLTRGEGGQPVFYDDYADGGGLYVRGLDLLIEDSQVNNNIAPDDGGGIYARHLYYPMRDVTVEVINSEVDNNITAMGDGGGIYINNRIFMDDDISIEFDEELSEGFDDIEQLNGDNDVVTFLTVDNSTVDWNRSGEDGGGIYFEIYYDLPYYYEYEYPEEIYEDMDYHYEIINGSSVSNNRTNGEDGGGIYHQNGYGLIKDSTVEANVITELGSFDNADHDELTALMKTPIPTGPIEDYFFDDIVDVFEDYVDPASGAGIYFNEQGEGGMALLNIDNSLITRNMGGEDDGDGAGAVYLGDGVVFISETDFISNFAIEYVEPGGAIYIEEALVRYITDSNFLGNGSTDDGGAIYNYDGTIDLIKNTTFDNNYADYSGGAIYNYSYIDLIINSTFSNNYADDNGGGIYNRGTIDRIENSTISNNYADGSGGGIYNTESINTINFVTIAFNEHDGIYADSGSYIGNLRNTIIANNLNNDDIEGKGKITSGGFNLIGSADGASGLSVHISDMVGTDILPIPPGLDPLLALNGSVNGTKTHALLIMSPAIDNAEKKSPETDQRGLERPFGDYPDIGAVEFGATMPPTEELPPIVLDLDGDGIELIRAQDSQVTIESENGTVSQVGWISGDDALLVYDHNQDGLINSLSEIQLTLYHPEAQTDLEGLKLGFDTNFDNLFNSMDDEFSSFGIWNDANENGVTDHGEYQTLEQAGIIELDLSAVESTQWVEGNQIFAEGLFAKEDGSFGTFADVALSKEVVLENDIDGIEAVPTATFTEVAQLDPTDSAPLAHDTVVEQAVEQASTANDLA